MTKTAHRIGASEDKLIAFLARYVRARADQCTLYAYSPGSLKFVRKKLAALVAAGYVEAYKGFSNSGKPPLVYSPSMKGWRYAEEHHGLPIPKHWRPSEAQLTDFRDYLHDLAITDFGIAVERFCREADPLVKAVRILHDRFLPQTRVQLPDGSRPAIRLDAFIELRIRRGDPPRTTQRCFLAEIDRGTHYVKAIQQKIRSQIAYVQGGHYQTDFGTQSLTYLWLCPDEDRVKQLVKIVEATLTEQQAQAFAQLYLFTAANPAAVDPIALFTRPLWRMPFASDPIKLLGFAPPTATVRLNHSRYLPQADYERFLTATGEGIPFVSSELDTE
jgi:DNA-binding PadR family transcriptional regulator